MSARPMPPIMMSDQLISSTVTSTVPGTSKRSAPESTFPRRTMPGEGNRQPIVSVKITKLPPRPPIAQVARLVGPAPLCALRQRP